MPGAENLDGGEGGADYGELGGVLRDAGARRKRPAWVVVVAAARIAWARGMLFPLVVICYNISL